MVSFARADEANSNEALSEVFSGEVNTHLELRRLMLLIFT
jgi:hypothetical protein